MADRTCTCCGQTKPITEYHKKTGRVGQFLSHCKTCGKEKKRKWATQNKEKVAAYDKKYREENPEVIRAIARQAYQRRPHVFKEAARRRIAACKQATPNWLSKEDKAAIQYIYAWCHYATQSTGVKHHVDHIHPLKGKNVCGLHVPWNLTVLTAHENSRKSNKLIA